MFENFLQTKQGQLKHVFCIQALIQDPLFKGLVRVENELSFEEICSKKH